MARTQLLSEIGRAMRLALYSHVTRTRPSELLEQIAEARWSRRRFLAAAATATAGLAVAAVDRPALGANGPEVVVVGAGCAGLTCAFRLQQAGVRARVLEAGSRLGGRIVTLRNTFPAGQSAELGGEFVATGHTSLRRLAGELKLKLIDLTADALEGDTYFFGGRRVPFSEIVEGLRPAAAHMLRDLRAISGDGAVTYRTPNHGKTLDRTSVAEWLHSRVEAGVIRDILEVAFVAEYGLDAGDQSSLNLLFTIGRPVDAAEFFGDSEIHFRLADGNDSLPTRLAGRLERSVETGTQLEAIRRASNGAYLLAVNRGGSVADIKADAVVLALPFTMLRRVDLQIELPPVKRLAIDTLGYGTNAKIVAGFSSRVWRAAGSPGSTLSDAGYQSSWDATRGVDGAHGVMTNFVGGGHGLALGEGTVEQRAAEFVAELDRVFPGAAAAFTQQAIRAHWPTSPLALGSYACYRPGQYSTIAGAEQERVGGLYFAGEHTSREYQGFMNGASASGERAAREVLARTRSARRTW